MYKDAMKPEQVSDILHGFPPAFRMNPYQCVFGVTKDMRLMQFFVHSYAGFICVVNFAVNETVPDFGYDIGKIGCAL